MNYRTYMRRIQNKIGITKSADGIHEPCWFEIVVRELNEISRDCAIQLQTDTGASYNKPNYELPFQEAPPTRLLSLEIALASWIGWIMQKKQPNPDDPFSARNCLKRIEEAYNLGVKFAESDEQP